LTIVFGYRHSDESVLYNTKGEEFNNYPFIPSLSHELAHRIDDMFKITANNIELTQAIHKAEKKAEMLQDKLVEYSWENDKYGHISDIFSAITKTDGFMAGHDVEYWNTTGRREAEIYANLFSLEALGCKKELEYIKTCFPEIVNAYMSVDLEVE